MVELIFLRLVATADQDAVAIGHLYHKARSSVIDSVHCLIEAGQRLTVKKASLPHGEWLPWLATNEPALGFKERAARLLVKAASDLATNRQPATDLTEVEDAIRFSRRLWGHAVRGTLGTGDNEWFTPAQYIRAVKEVMGGIDVDPASHPIAQETVGAARYFTRKRTGLRQEWPGRVFLNPPYAREEIGPFVEKLLIEIRCGRTTAAIMLTHNYTDTEWFHAAVAAADALCFTLGRVKFIDSCGEPANPTQGQTVFYYGPDVGLFHQVFQAFGFIAVPWGSQTPRRAVAEMACGLPGSDPAVEAEGLPRSTGDG
jgi:hypothetical protein